MKLIEFKEYNNLDSEKSLNKKKIIGFMITAVIIVLAITFSVVYACNKTFRNWADIHILMKSISEGS